MFVPNITGIDMNFRKEKISYDGNLVTQREERRAQRSAIIYITKAPLMFRI